DSGKEGKMELILRVTATDARATLANLSHLSLGLDIWEAKPDHMVVRAAEAQAERLRPIGYGVEELHQTANFLSAFATADALASYHSAATLEQDLSARADSQLDIAELREVGRSRSSSQPMVREPDTIRKYAVR